MNMCSSLRGSKCTIESGENDMYAKSKSTVVVVVVGLFGFFFSNLILLRKVLASLPGSPLSMQGLLMSLAAVSSYFVHGCFI